MKRIGVRELKANLSEVLRSVERGEPVRVTSHGRAVADIVPVGSPAVDERLRVLVEQGRFTPPTMPPPARAPRPAAAERSASEIVLAERDEER